MRIFHKFVLVLVILGLGGSGLNIYAQNGKKNEGNKANKENKIDKLLSKGDQEVFKKADNIEVLEIDGNSVNWVDFKKAENQILNEKDRFHGYKVLSNKKVSAEADKQKLTETLLPSIGEGMMARCFFPRHGLRATFNNNTVELLICFECGFVYAFNGKGYKYESISESLQDSLDSFLEDSKD